MREHIGESFAQGEAIRSGFVSPGGRRGGRLPRGSRRAKRTPGPSAEAARFINLHTAAGRRGYNPQFADVRRISTIVGHRWLRSHGASERQRRSRRTTRDSRRVAGHRPAIFAIGNSRAAARQVGLHDRDRETRPSLRQRPERGTSSTMHGEREEERRAARSATRRRTPVPARRRRRTPRRQPSAAQRISAMAQTNRHRRQLQDDVGADRHATPSPNAANTHRRNAG
jgi:hypothetical protein